MRLIISARSVMQRTTKLTHRNANSRMLLGLLIWTGNITFSRHPKKLSKLIGTCQSRSLWYRTRVYRLRETIQLLITRITMVISHEFSISLGTHSIQRLVGVLVASFRLEMPNCSTRKRIKSRRVRGISSMTFTVIRMLIPRVMSFRA
jgi:hypothetical protein